ncbi:uncharacterized protein TNCV_1131071 [Trichonephila clavipes]|nr:uncharacterized protein TNCV_1131071 [Trichonephila clavipes]
MSLSIISITSGIIGYVCVSLGSGIGRLRKTCKNAFPRTIPVSFGRLDTPIATESSLNFSGRRISDHRIFQRLHRQLREACSFHVTRHDAGRRKAVRSPSLEGSILNVVVDRPELNTRHAAPRVSVSHQTVCRALNENRLRLFQCQRVQALNPADYLLRLPEDGTTACAAARFHSSWAEQLL